MDPDLWRYPVVWAAARLQTAVFPVPPGTLRVLANATVAPIAEVQPVADREAAGGGDAGDAGTGARDAMDREAATNHTGS